MANNRIVTMANIADIFGMNFVIFSSRLRKSKLLDDPKPKVA